MFSFLCLQGISTGVHHAAVLTNCEASQTAVQEAGRTSGDLTFPIPYTPELHFKEFDSAVADMKNSVMVHYTYAMTWAVITAHVYI